MLEDEGGGGALPIYTQIILEPHPPLSNNLLT